ncbi:hypothetical protein PISMIDRAFT_671418 [Pisolithus microcarpus 441]|uniref:Uncharacterized protein n=1 Tax=Pisolithus microcarpus 441 TaxID=765257 RepID=A0A0D0A710_9AGAM|nr:hypothetical protein PISMIDRAFT_671418 [Pisolithus microcarpus 441]
MLCYTVVQNVQHASCVISFNSWRTERGGRGLPHPLYETEINFNTGAKRGYAL